MDSGAHHNRILNNVIDYVGSYDNGDPANPDTGDSIGITEGAHHNLIDGNLITHGFHNLLAVRGEFNVIRNNILDNNNFGLGLGLGGRDGEVVGQRNIFESNIVRNAGASADNPFNSGFKAEGRGTIVRRNVIFANSGHGIKTEMRDRQPYAQDIHIFHNTFVDNGGPAWQNRHYTEGFLPSGNVFKNNIVFRNRKSAMPGGDDADFAFMGSDGGQLTDTLIESNLVSMQSAGDGKVYVKNEWNFQSLTEAQQHFPNNFRDNIQAVPQFVATQFSVTQDFKLKPGSRGIDEGKPLTRTTGSGSGTQVPVQDAGFFSDGFGLVPGDSIRVGNEPAVQINSINYGTDTITVSRSLQWQAGASVTLDYAGSAPDIGAVELDLEDVSETRPRPPQLIVLQ